MVSRHRDPSLGDRLILDLSVFQIPNNDAFPAGVELSPDRVALKDRILPLMLRTAIYLKMVSELLDGSEDRIVDVVYAVKVGVVICISEHQG